WDYAANVGKRAIALNQTPPGRPGYALPCMAHLAELLVKEGMDAYVAHDAANGAKRAIALNTAPPVRRVSALPRMAHLAELLVKEVIDAYVAHDAEKSYAVWTRDAELDEMYSSLFRELLTYMMEDPRKTSACTHLLS